MGIRYMNEVAQDIIKRGMVNFPEKCITGGDFEKWLCKGELGMNFNNMTNDELIEQLYKEFLFYDDDLLTLCKIVRKQLPRKMVYRIISKLYRIRNK